MFFTAGTTVDSIERDYEVIQCNDREECLSNDMFENSAIFFCSVRDVQVNYPITRMPFQIISSLL